MKESVRTGTHIVRTVAVVFPYMCLKQKPNYLSNTEWRPDGIATSSGRMHLNVGFFSNSKGRLYDLPLRPDGCNLEQFKVSRH